MERGRECVERNRSERAKIAKVAEWKPPASPEARCALAETDNLEPHAKRLDPCGRLTVVQ